MADSGRRLAPATLAVVGALLLLVSCAAGPNTAESAAADAAGFWLGVWHGFISPVTFIVGLFTEEVSIYEVENNGNLYDFGFVIGLAIIWSGGGPGAKAARAQKR